MRSNRQKTNSATIGIGSILVLFGLVVSALLNYLYNFILASEFGAIQAGDFLFTLTVITITSMVSQVGAQELLLKYVGAYWGSNEVENTGSVIRFGFVIGIIGSTVGSLFLWGSAESIAVLAKKPETEFLIRDLSPLCLALTVVNLCASALQGAKQVSKSTILRDVGKPLAIAVSLLIAAFFSGQILQTTTALLITHLMLALCAISYFFLYFRAEITSKSITYVYKTRYWIRFSLSVLLLDLFRSAFGWVDVLILGFLVSSEELAVYFIAVRTTLLIQIILRAFNAVLSPLVAAYWYENNLLELGNAFKSATKWTWVLTIPTSIAILILSEDIMSLFGETFADSHEVLQIIVFGQLINCLTGGVGRILMMTGLQRLELYNSIAVFLGILIGTTVSAKYFGLIGVAVTASLTISIANVVKLYQVYRYHKIHPFDLTYLRILMCGLLTLAVGFVMSNSVSTNRIISITVAIPSMFFILCYFANILSSEEKAMVLQRVKIRSKT